MAGERRELAAAALDEEAPVVLPRLAEAPAQIARIALDRDADPAREAVPQPREALVELLDAAGVRAAAPDGDAAVDADEPE